MNKLFWIGWGCWAFFLLTACERPGEKGSESGAVSASAATVIVAYGDSLTAGQGVAEEEAYPARLEAKLKEAGHSVQVVNGGVSGETSSGALSRLAWILTLKPAIVILETGGNDGLRGIPPALIEENIDSIVERLQAEGVVVVLAGMQIFHNLGAEYAQAFAELYPRVAKRQGVILVPFFLQGVVRTPAMMQTDALHPNAAGYRVVVETLYPYVEAALKQVERARSSKRPGAAGP